jgi:hypothetical protein
MLTRGPRSGRDLTSVREEGIEAKHLVRASLELSATAREGIGVAQNLIAGIHALGI